MPRVHISARQVKGWHAHQLDRLAAILAARSDRRRDRMPRCLCGRHHVQEPNDPPIPPGLSEACSRVLLARAAGNESEQVDAEWDLFALILPRVASWNGLRRAADKPADAYPHPPRG